MNNRETRTDASLVDDYHQQMFRNIPQEMDLAAEVLDALNLPLMAFRLVASRQELLRLLESADNQAAQARQARRELFLMKKEREDFRASRTKKKLSHAKRKH